MLQVLGRSSSINVRKVLWTCDELGLTIAHDAAWAGERSTREPAFLALNPNALVPVLRDGDFVLWESNTICRYLATREGRTDLLPADPRERARVEQWMDWQATALNTAWRYAFMHHVRRSPQFPDAAAARASEADWHRHMALLDAQLARTGAFVTGTGFTLADVVLGLSTVRWRLTPMARPALPAVEAWFGRLQAREGFRRWGDNGTP